MKRVLLLMFAAAAVPLVAQAEATAALKATKKADHLRVTVQGEQRGKEIQVKSVLFD